MTDRAGLWDAAVELLWAHWSVLGVPGASVVTRDVVSPVDLVLYTPVILGDRDARLSALVQAWCAQHGARVFGSRELEVRRGGLPGPAQAAWDAWAAVLFEAAGSPWPAPRPSLDARGPAASPRELPFRSDRRAAVYLRARSLFGIGVRADLVCALLGAHARGVVLTSGDVAHFGHSARAVQLALAALEAAGVVVSAKAGRTHAHRLARPAELVGLLDAADLRWVDWHHAMPVVAGLAAWAVEPAGDPGVARVRAHAVARTLAPHAQALPGILPLHVRAGADDAADALLAWGLAALRSLGSGGVVAPR